MLRIGTLPPIRSDYPYLIIVAWPEPFRAAFEQVLPRSVHGCTIGARLLGPFDVDEPLGGAVSGRLGLVALALVSRINVGEGVGS